MTRTFDGTITWLGHSAFVVESARGKRILIDPFITGNPRAPEGIDVDPVDFIAISHGHGDHVGDAPQIAQRTGATIIAPVELCEWLAREGMPQEQLIDLNKGGTATRDGISFTLTHAQHSSSNADGQYLGEPCGIVLTLEDGFRIYHAGDTNVFGDMRLIGELYPPDLAMLPIGDHYTMGPGEAAHATRLLGVRDVIPMHYGTFPVLTGTPQQLQELLGGDATVHVLEPGVAWGRLGAPA